MLPAGTLLDGNYKIVDVIGSGSFGITYEAEDVNLHTKVALKEYYPAEFGERDASLRVQPKSDSHRRRLNGAGRASLGKRRRWQGFATPALFV